MYRAVTEGCVRQINYFRGCDLALTIPDVMLKTQFNGIYIVVFERKLETSIFI